MTTGLTLQQALMSPTMRQLSAPFNNPAANVQQLAQPMQQPMAQPMAQGQGPSFQFQDLNRAFQLDPRNTLSNTLLEQGMRGGSVRTRLEALGTLPQTLAGAILKKTA